MGCCESKDEIVFYKPEQKVAYNNGSLNWVLATVVESYQDYVVIQIDKDEKTPLIQVKRNRIRPARWESTLNIARAQRDQKARRPDCTCPPEFECYCKLQREVVPAAPGLSLLDEKKPAALTVETSVTLTPLPHATSGITYVKPIDGFRPVLESSSITVHMVPITPFDLGVIPHR